MDFQNQIKFNNLFNIKRHWDRLNKLVLFLWVTKPSKKNPKNLVGILVDNDLSISI
jgi:hypothetical protein